MFDVSTAGERQINSDFDVIDQCHFDAYLRRIDSIIYLLFSARLVRTINRSMAEGWFAAHHRLDKIDVSRESRWLAAEI